MENFLGNSVFIAYKAGGLESMVLSRLLGREIRTSDFVKIMKENKDEKEAADEFVKKDGWLDKKLHEMADCMGRNANRIYHWLGNALGQKEAFDMVFPPARCRFVLDSDNKINVSNVVMDTHITSKLHDCFVVFSRALTMVESKDKCAEFFRQMEKTSNFPTLQGFFNFIDSIKEEFGSEIEHVVNDETIAEAWKRVSKNKLSVSYDGMDCYMIDEWEDMYQVANNPRFTKWCVAENTEDYGKTYFDDYAPPYYMICKGHEPVALMNPSDRQFKDKNDEAYYKDDYNEDGNFKKNKSVICFGFLILEEIDYTGRYTDDFDIFEECRELDPFNDRNDKTDYKAIMEKVDLKDSHDEDAAVDENKKSALQEKNETLKNNRLTNEEIKKNLAQDARYYVKKILDFSLNLNEVKQIETILKQTRLHGGKGIVPELVNAVFKDENLQKNIFVQTTISEMLKESDDVERIWDSLDSDEQTSVVANTYFIKIPRISVHFIEKLYGLFKNDVKICQNLLDVAKCPMEIQNQIAKDFPSNSDIQNKMLYKEGTFKGCSDPLYMKNKELIEEIFKEGVSVNTMHVDSLLSLGNFSDEVIEEIIGNFINANVTYCADKLMKNKHLSENQMLEILHKTFVKESNRTLTSLIPRNLLTNPNCTEKVIDEIFKNFDQRTLFHYGSDTRKNFLELHADKLTQSQIELIYNKGNGLDMYEHKLLAMTKNCPYELFKQYCHWNPDDIMNLDLPAEKLMKLYDEDIPEAISNKNFPTDMVAEFAKNGSPMEKICALDNVNCPPEILEHEYKNLSNDDKDLMTTVISNPSFRTNDISKMEAFEDVELNEAIVQNGSLDTNLTVSAIAKIFSNEKNWVENDELMCGIVNKILEGSDLSRKEACIRAVKLPVERYQSMYSIDGDEVRAFIRKMQEVETFRWASDNVDILHKIMTTDDVDGLVFKRTDVKQECLQALMVNSNGTLKTNSVITLKYIDAYGLDDFCLMSGGFLNNMDSFRNYMDDTTFSRILNLVKEPDEKYFSAYFYMANNGNTRDVAEGIAKFIGTVKCVDKRKNDLLKAVLENPLFGKDEVELVMRTYAGNLMRFPYEIVEKFLNRFGFTQVIMEHLQYWGDAFEDEPISVDFSKCSREDIVKAMHCPCSSIRYDARRYLRHLAKGGQKSANVKAGIITSNLIADYVRLDSIARRVMKG